MFPGVAGMEELPELAIKGTSYILLEMPFEVWSEGTFRTLNAIRNRGLYPIIAHIERYLSFQKGTQNIERLMRSDEMCIRDSIVGFIENVRAIKNTALYFRK